MLAVNWPLPNLYAPVKSKIVFYALHRGKTCLTYPLSVRFEVKKDPEEGLVAETEKEIGLLMDWYPVAGGFESWMLRGVVFLGVLSCMGCS